MVPKFRAYIKDTDDLDYNDVPHKGHFVYGNLIKGKSNDDVDAIVGNLIEINDEYVNVEWWCSIEKGSAEQSTGLKDANGKEIYEGDIIVSKPNDPELEPPKIGVVKRSKIDAGWCYRTATDDYNIWTSGKYRTYEIIGNVHTNPELLEAQHDTRTD